MSLAASNAGAPNAAAEIARKIGESTLRWREADIEQTEKANNENP